MRQTLLSGNSQLRDNRRHQESVYRSALFRVLLTLGTVILALGFSGGYHSGIEK